MSVMLSAASLITNLGSLGSNFVGVENSGSRSGESLAAMATSSVGDLGGLAAMGGKMAIGNQLELAARNLPQGTKTNSIASQGSFILLALNMVEIVEMMTGFGEPCEGDDFKTGADQFIALAQQLAAAVPLQEWQGTASEAYAGQDATLEDLAKQMAELDLDFAAIVKDQAEWVTHIRLGLGILKDLLLAAFAIYWAIMLTLPVPANLSTAKIFEFTVCGIAIALTTGMVSTLIAFSVENGKKADALAPRYEEVAAAAVLPGTDPAPDTLAAAEEVTVSSFDDISSDLSPMPAIATLAQLAPGQGDSAGEESSAADRSEVSETPATPLARARGATAPGQQATSSGNASPRLASTSRPKQRAARPVEETAVEETAVDAAAAGTTGAGYVPIDIVPQDSLQTNAVRQPESLAYPVAR